MEAYYIAIALILSALLLAITGCLIYFKILDKASKIIAVYLVAAFITELLAFIGLLNNQYNISVYNSFSIIQYILLISYFGTLHNKYAYRILLLIGVSFYIINHFFFQDFSSQPNSNFLAFESVTVVFLVLIYFYRQLSQKNSSYLLTHHFWFNAILLTFWSFTLIIWVIGYTLHSPSLQLTRLLNYMMWAINIITYTGFGLVFLFYKKLQNDE